MIGYRRNESPETASPRIDFSFQISAFLLGWALLTHGAYSRAEVTEAPSLPPICSAQCAAPFGEVLGRSPRGVVAYSNCRAECVVPDSHEVDGTYTGLQWQCVEYARRWLLVNRGAVFGDVDIAADIWTKIDRLTRVSDQTEVPLEARLNGSSQRPQAGDLLIYAKAFYGTGHVAVVVGSDPSRNLLKVGEQNYNNEVWTGSHAREIEFIEKDGRFWVLDPYLIGWKHLGQVN
jgi:glutathionylspermidine amidase/synthetase